MTLCTAECPQSCILQVARYPQFPLLQAGYLNKVWSPTLPGAGGTFPGSVYNPSWSRRYSPGLFILRVPASTPVSSLLLTENLITICISAQEMEGWSVAGVPCMSNVTRKQVQMRWGLARELVIRGAILTSYNSSLALFNLFSLLFLFLETWSYLKPDWPQSTMVYVVLGIRTSS